MTRTPRHPGLILKEDVLYELSISIPEAAKQVAVSRSAMYRLINCKVRISPVMAGKLGRWLKGHKAYRAKGAVYWLRMQNEYDLWSMDTRLFLYELNRLTLKHNIVIGGCGCCGSPYLEKRNAEKGGHYEMNDKLRWKED